MEIHRPKGPVHGWRELAKEIGIIVVGVLIALGAEQAVEALHWRQRVGEAEDAMRAELRQNLRDGYYRLAIRPCLDGQLDAFQRTLETSRDTGAPVPLMPHYATPLRPWQSDEWDSARALQITGHMPTDRLTAWSQAFFFAVAIRGSQADEQLAATDLNTLAINAGRLDPAERDRLFRALVRARRALRLMSLGPTLLSQRAAALDIRLSPTEQQAALAEAKADFGACVTAPDLAAAQTPPK